MGQIGAQCWFARPVCGRPGLCGPAEFFFAGHLGAKTGIRNQEISSIREWGGNRQWGKNHGGEIKAGAGRPDKRKVQAKRRGDLSANGHACGGVSPVVPPGRSPYYPYCRINPGP